MQAFLHVTGFSLVLLLTLGEAAAVAETSNQPVGNLAAPNGQHHGALLAKPVTPPKSAPREPVHPAGATPVVKPHGPTHAQKPVAKGAAKSGGKSAAPPPVMAAPAPAPEPATPPVAADTAKGSVTGFPVPRFAALRTDDVNLRRGPGTRYPIDWVYKRRDLPVEIEREFEVWRLITDPDGTKGWVHQATLTGRRTLIVTGGERVLRHDASDTSAPVAKLKPGVIGHIRSCDAGSDWCQMQVGEYRGYLKREEVWGVLPNEAVGN